MEHPDSDVVLMSIDEDGWDGTMHVPNDFTHYAPRGRGGHVSSYFVSSRGIAACTKIEKKRRKNIEKKKNLEPA